MFTSRVSRETKSWGDELGDEGRRTKASRIQNKNNNIKKYTTYVQVLEYIIIIGADNNIIEQENLKISPPTKTEMLCL